MIKSRNSFLPIATAVFGKEEEKEIIETLRSGWVTLGPKTKLFEELLVKYTGAKYAVALNSCSSALHLALVALNLKKGDEVITTTFTFAATVNAILHTGAKAVLVDIDPQTFNVNLDQVEKKITKKTKAIIPVHYAGQSVDLDILKKLCKKHDIVLVEDAAHAIGTEYKNKKIGNFGDMTCFSFHPVKNMTTGDGGAITTNNKLLYEKLLVLRVNGMDKESWKRNTSTGKWDYAIVDEGYKFHMNDLSASLGIHQIKKLDKYNLKRKQIADSYDNKLSKIPEITIPDRETKFKNMHSHNLYPILVDTSNLRITRNEIIDKLKEYNIGSIVYYRPIHMHHFYQERLGYEIGDFPIAEHVFERLICLPIYPLMKASDINYVSNVLKEIISDNRV